MVLAPVGAVDHPQPIGHLHHDVDACVEATIAAVGPNLVLGTPLGIGKPNHLINGFYRRALAEPEISLTILTALSLDPPRADAELARRLVDPIRARLYAGYTPLDYVAARRAEELPQNVRVIEFFFAPGSLLSAPAAQRDHVSIDYSHAATEILDRGLNVLAQLVSPGPGGLSLSCNPDLTLDLLPELLARRARGVAIRVLGQLDSRLPYMPGPSVIPAETFDLLLGERGHELEPFPIPSRPVETADHCIGLHASALVRDGGTIQIGIGQLGDALTHALILRHEHGHAYREWLGGAPQRAIGGDQPFRRGLYAASEMLSEGLVELFRRGILRREVFDELALQRAIDDGCEAIDVELFERLRDAGLGRERLCELGVLRHDAPADLGAVAARHLGDRLRGGVVAHAGFFLGSRRMYQTLRELEPEDRAKLQMTAISRVNALFGHAELAAAQRRHARFVNTGMKVTLAGALVSDALADGRYVSGVGGQHDFAVMSHQLPEARFVALVRATREAHGSIESNVVLAYPHLTLPDHLRDLVVTEYGVADLRGRTTGEVAEALIEVADARFQDRLIRRARAAGKLRPSWRLPDRARANTPERIERDLDRLRARAPVPRFVFGSDLTAVELDLADALAGLRERFSPGAALRSARIPAAAGPYLERMGLDAPRSMSERLQRRAVVYALHRADLL